MITALILAAAQATDAPAAPDQPDCSYDLKAMLELDLNAFDQDLEGGWRKLARKEGCDLAAAELIREWRHTKRDHRSVLYWHEGQLRAQVGQTEEAIALFELTYSAPEFDTDFGWNHYVSGTIAFLRDDREGLEKSIERLKAVPEPSNNSFTRPDGTVFQMAWPPNLHVLEAFERCWGKSYKIAYGPECAEQAAT